MNILCLTASAEFRCKESQPSWRNAENRSVGVIWFFNQQFSALALSCPYSRKERKWRKLNARQNCAMVSVILFPDTTKHLAAQLNSNFPVSHSNVASFIKAIKNCGVLFLSHEENMPETLHQIHNLMWPTFGEGRSWMDSTTTRIQTPSGSTGTTIVLPANHSRCIWLVSRKRSLRSAHALLFGSQTVACQRTTCQNAGKRDLHQNSGESRFGTAKSCDLLHCIECFASWKYSDPCHANSLDREVSSEQKCYVMRNDIRGEKGLLCRFRAVATLTEPINVEGRSLLSVAQPWQQICKENLQLFQNSSQVYTTRVLTKKFRRLILHHDQVEKTFTFGTACPPPWWSHARLGSESLWRLVLCAQLDTHDMNGKFAFWLHWKNFCRHRQESRIRLKSHPNGPA